MKQRQDREDEGFTLIELMVVVLIIAILLAIAIPTFLGARQRANDRAAQSSLRNALTAAKTIYTDSQSYASADDVELAKVEPSLDFEPSTTASAGSGSYKKVSVDGSAGTVWFGAALSASGTCFQIKDNSGSGGDGTTYRKGSTTCSGGDAKTNSTSFTPNGW